MADNTDSILDKTKQALGIEPEYTHFDSDIIMHINSSFSTLHSLGIGPEDGFEIEDNSTTWEEYLGGDKKLNMVKSLVVIDVRLVFDPPATSFAIDALTKKLEEYKWRAQKEVETAKALAADPANTLIWLIDATQPFPEEAPINALGYDPVKGQFWRKKS